MTDYEKTHDNSDGTWSRHVRVDALTAAGLETNVGATNEAVAATPSTTSGLNGLLRGLWTALIAVLQVGGSAASGATAAGNPVPIGGDSNTTMPTVTNGQRVTAQFTSRGLLKTLTSFIAGNANGSDGLANSNQAQLNDSATLVNAGLFLPVWNYLFNGASHDRLVKPNATSRIASAGANVNATSAKGSAGNVFRVMGNNVKASVVYLKIYNKATAPTVGTDTPVITIPLAASARFNEPIADALGFYLGTGIAYGFTTDAADNGTTALSAGDILDFTLTYS